MGLKTKITVTKRIVVNGREYDRPEDMPDELRNAYESAMKKMKSGRVWPILKGFKAKIVLNGREYGSEEEMPQEEHGLYKLAIDSLEGDKSNDKQRLYSAPIEPAGAVSPSGRSKLLFIVGGVILGLLLFLYLLSNGY